MLMVVAGGGRKYLAEATVQTDMGATECTTNLIPGLPGWLRFPFGLLPGCGVPWACPLGLEQGVCVWWAGRQRVHQGVSAHLQVADNTVGLRLVQSTRRGH
jgi:hypothetical protein